MRMNKDNVELGLGVTVLGYSDSHSYTVVKISENKNKVTLQRDKAVRLTQPEFIHAYASTSNMKSLPIPTTSTPKRTESIGLIKPVIVGRNEYYDYNF